MSATSDGVRGGPDNLGAPLPRKTERVRMSGRERREQLVQVAAKLFADKGFEAVTIEEIAARASVSKPVVYEHFGSKDGLYAVIVDREMNILLGMVTDSLTADRPRDLLEQAATALFDYIEGRENGFRIMVRDSPVAQNTGNFASLLRDVASQVEALLGKEFDRSGFPSKFAPMYAHMLVGMVALTGQWWLDVRKPKKDEVIAHVVNLAWNGIVGLEKKPGLATRRG
ncbi:MAG TPA: TetR/AcrR family transcriptional regulator [Candidatus Nanopelagicales bacterium]|nr:TetR/AcrR family transcriptional regulator [Candidatus Nanopelagicales bacterium]